MTEIGLILQLAWTFFIIGAFTFGGGYAMLSLIQSEVVTRHAWLSESTFTDIVAVSQMTPGPIGINTATYTGYNVLFEATGSQVMGMVGSASATLALILPSLILMLLIVRFYMSFKSSTLYAGAMQWVKPAVTGLIGAAALILIVSVSWDGWIPSARIVEANFTDFKSWILLAASFAATYWGKMNPIHVIIAAAVLGVLLY